jgi:hypothetical protein
MEMLGFQHCNVDQAVFYHHNDEGIVVMAVQIDDCTITAHPRELVDEVKRKLGTADHGGFKFITYVLNILWHIYSSLINMRCLYILPHI